MLIQVVSFAVIVAAATVWLRSSVVKQHHEELSILADTRGHRIDDLESEVKQLRDEVKRLDGQMAGLQSLKASEIANEVIHRLGEGTPDGF